MQRGRSPFPAHRLRRDRFRERETTGRHPPIPGQGPRKRQARLRQARGLVRTCRRWESHRSVHACRSAMR